MTADPGDRDALARALAYARHGWPVFPCKPGRKEPDTPHGFKDATTDPGRITTWWTAEPGRNVAIATGAPGPDVLDVDIRPGGSGYPAFRRLQRAGLLDSSHAIVATPSGGLHAYYTGTSQASGRLPGHHLDFKAAGGYVLAPPSAIGGRPYRLIWHQQDRQPESGWLDWAAATALLDPPRLRPQLARQPELPADATRLAAWVAELPEGNRNAGLFWAACRAAETSDPGALDALARAARTAGLPEREIQRTITSARRSAGHSQLTHTRPQRCTKSEPDPESEAVI
jgi:Bifunctional DNA primase/polymerase, N-terminal